MTISKRERQLVLFLRLMAAFLVIGLPLLVYAWPSGWRWTPHNQHYEHMILAIHATLGGFLLLASRNSVRHRTVIWFAVWLLAIHGAVMAIDAAATPSERGHLLGDVPFGLAGALVLGILTRRAPGSRAG